MSLRELLAALPDDAPARAARARRRALARLDAGAGSRNLQVRGWRWVLVAAALAALVGGAVWFERAWRVETLAWQPPAPVIAPVKLSPPPGAQPARVPVQRARRPGPLQVQLALGDGTRVYWTFDDNFSLRGEL